MLLLLQLDGKRVVMEKNVAVPRVTVASCFVQTPPELASHWPWMAGGGDTVDREPWRHGDTFLHCPVERLCFHWD